VDYNYFIAEMNAAIANMERIKRELEQSQAEEIARPPQSHTQTHPPAPEPSQIHDPLAKSMADLVTPKQLGMIRALAREAALEPDEECQRVFRCNTEELSKRAASSFIEHLQKTKQEFERAEPRRAS
jgi:hypothetical protein